MLKIGEYIEFFSEWHAVFSVDYIDLPVGPEKDKNGKQWEDVQWYCESINGLVPTLFDDKLIEFSSLIKEIGGVISSQSSALNDLLRRENWVVLRRKVEILRGKFIIEKWETPDPVRPYMPQKCYFDIGNGLEIDQTYFDEYEIQENDRWNQLLNYYPGYLTLHFWPFKKDLDELLPLLDALVGIDTPVIQIPKVDLTSTHALRGGTKTELEVVNNFPCFLSDYFSFQPVVDTLYDFFVATKDTPIKSIKYFAFVPKSDFNLMFTAKSNTIKYVALDWKGSKVAMRYFLTQLQEIFKIGRKHIDIYYIADQCVLYKKEKFPHSTKLGKGNKPVSWEELKAKMIKCMIQYPAKKIP